MMTRKDFYEKVMAITLDDADVNDVYEYAKEQVDKMKKNDAERDEKRTTILGAVSATEFMTAQEISDALEGLYSMRMVSSNMTLMVKDGLAEKRKGKSGKMEYRKIETFSDPEPIDAGGITEDVASWDSSSEEE